MSRESRMSTLSASVEDVIADEQLPGDKPSDQHNCVARCGAISPEFHRVSKASVFTSVSVNFADLV